MVNNTYNYLLSDLKDLKGVGIKTYNILKKKKINNIFDLLWRLPKSYTDRSKSTKIKDLKIGEEQTVILTPFKNKYQITNTKYVSEDSTLIKDKHNKYSLTEGISEKVYNKIINQILTNLPIIE